MFNSPVSIPHLIVKFLVGTFVFFLFHSIESIKPMCYHYGGLQWKAALQRKQWLTELVCSLALKISSGIIHVELDILGGKSAFHNLKIKQVYTFLMDECLSETPFSETNYLELFFSFLSLSIPIIILCNDILSLRFLTIK